MAEYPYINTIGKLQEFIEKISEMSVPISANTNWLPTVGFASRNHRPIIKIMKFIGFLDGNSPTQRWQSFRDNTQAARVMADGIRSGYADLYRTYDDAHERSDEELRNFFKGKMSGGDQVIGSTVSTFKTLCSFADFSGMAGNVAAQRENGRQDSENSNATLASPPNNIDPSAPALHIDIQVHISADASETQIDKIFESMAKHLYGKVAE